MRTTEQLSRLMRISWQIQRRKRVTRSKALQAAWAIVNNEDITVQYLVRKLNRHKEVPYHTLSQFKLFTDQ